MVVPGQERRRHVSFRSSCRNVVSPNRFRLCLKKNRGILSGCPFTRRSLSVGGCGINACDLSNWAIIARSSLLSRCPDQCASAIRHISVWAYSPPSNRDCHGSDERMLETKPGFGTSMLRPNAPANVSYAGVPGAPELECGVAPPVGKTGIEQLARPSAAIKTVTRNVSQTGICVFPGDGPSLTRRVTTPENDPSLTRRVMTPKNLAEKTGLCAFARQRRFSGVSV